MKFNRSCLLMPTPNANDGNDNVIEKDVTDALNCVRTQPFPNLEESLNQIDEMNTRIVKNMSHVALIDSDGWITNATIPLVSDVGGNQQNLICSCNNIIMLT